ncbi:capsular polysaccharide synthesis protein [Bifidobacterium aquikefiricola]|uniref:Capsular polysaccharide synthesis protein n=1 Tax=Bifidobacterium aquikefiricola TaxID=3059038 RepID=A0AB39U4U0_9BIFI
MAGTGQFHYLSQISKVLGTRVAFYKMLNHVNQDRFGKAYYRTLCQALGSKVYDNVAFDEQALHNAQLIEPTSPIWIMWWDGEKEFPPLVKCCVDSVRRNAGTHPVIIISKSNLSEYVQIPSVILGKVQDGTISVTAFSDIVRFALLRRYGGLWLDATIVLRVPVGKLIDGKQFFSLRRGNSYKPKIAVWSGEWTVFCIGGGKGNPVFDYMYKALTTYWNRTNVLVDYFLIDCTISIMYDAFFGVREQFGQIPKISYNLYELEADLNKDNDSNVVSNLHGDIYKLNRKTTHVLKTIDGHETVYSRFLQVDL